MIKLVSSILVIFAGYFLFFGTSECFGLDEDGCLTCHQYPGLVRLRKRMGSRYSTLMKKNFSLHRMVNFVASNAILTSHRFPTRAKQALTAPLNVIRTMPRRFQPIL